jgi:hypothetical protein
MTANKVNLVRTTIRVPKDIWKAAKIKAAKDGSSLQELVTTAIEESLRRRPRQRDSIVAAVREYLPNYHA